MPQKLTNCKMKLKADRCLPDEETMQLLLLLQRGHYIVDMDLYLINSKPLTKNRNNDLCS